MIIRPLRTHWDRFSDLLIHADERGVKTHPDYPAAKAGDVDAALQLIRDSLNPALLHPLSQMGQGTKPVLISVHAEEETGRNAIPEVLADALAVRLDWELESSVVQANVVNHTGADGFSRLARQAVFAGSIEPGRDYVIVDDFVGQGGTIANLRGHICHQGGRVLGATVLTGKTYSAILVLSSKRLQELRAKHGNLETWWKEQFGFGFDWLTESEARYLIRTQNADTIRNRIAAAAQTVGG